MFFDELAARTTPPDGHGSDRSKALGLEILDALREARGLSSEDPPVGQVSLGLPNFEPESRHIHVGTPEPRYSDW